MRFSNERLLEGIQLLHDVKADSERVELLLPLQKILIRELIRTERAILLLKKARIRLTKSKSKKRNRHEGYKSKNLKKLLKKCKHRIEDYHHYRFLWRCIGDGIAAIYQNKFSLKHLYYDSEYMPKEDPGFISGKSGFLKEYKLFVKGIQMNVPVVLSDLTNIIRHGDICALGSNEPMLIEVKSSGNKNSRVSRQIEQLKELEYFFSNDEIENFRGNGPTQRIASVIEEHIFAKEINECIESAMSNGVGISIPEKGLRYIAIRNDLAISNREQLSETLGTPSRHLLIVHVPCDQRLLPSYPFILTLQPSNALFFMSGLVSLMVEIDLKRVKQLFNENGLFAVVLLDGELAIQVMFDENNLSKGGYWISEPLFLRIATEFLSMEDFVKNQAKMEVGDFSELKSGIENAKLTEYLENFSDLKDCFE